MNTTIDDKARRLVLSFTQFTGERHEVSSEDAKQCALICVDEMLEHEKNNHSALDGAYENLLKLKEKIQSL